MNHISRPIGGFLALLLFVSTGTVTAQSVDKAASYKIASVDSKRWMESRYKDDVKIEIDRIIDAGFNTVSLGTFKFMPMYFVDYTGTKYQDAQDIPLEKVRQNVSVLRANMQYAKKKGIKWMISRSYSHYIPYKFWKGRVNTFNPEGIYTRYLENAHQNDLWQAALAGKGDVIGHQQWTNPVYKDFFISSTIQMMKALPELDGFLNAYAEAAWTLNEDKLKENQWKTWKDCINYPATDENFVDYVNNLHHILQDVRGKKFFLGIRDWYVDAKVLAKLDFPLNECAIVVKYGGFDQPVANYAPWADSLKAKGVQVIHDMLVFDAEHPHPLYWYDHAFITKLIQNIYQSGFAGIQYQDFQIKGDDEPNNPIRLLTQQTVGTALKGERFERSNALIFLKKYYGNGADALLKSMELVTKAQIENIKLKPAWFWQGDGLTPGGLGTERYWMFMDNPDAPKGMSFIRQDMVGVKEYTDALIAGKAELSAAMIRWKKNNRKTPYEAMAQMEQDAKLAVSAALEGQKQAPKNAPHLQEIIASAVIHQQLVNRDNAFLKSALAFYISGGQFDGKYNTNQNLLNTGIDEKSECKVQLEKEMYYDLLIRELCFKYMPRRRAVRGSKPYDFTRRIASIIGQPIADTETVDRKELNRLITMIAQ
ncbi:MAG: hypothetical protein P0Y49_09520 [Candidatus Pedobacter colombiensis]|uniref:Uncharacterized protein n=1 Tax=Candidatus Pedobacter colombiensis TaxID=3121371 RepID=A0AAJ6B8Z3_9SPHI|nr:hypothetical protein [Pedobacter sp.]WEK21379.1 MAG: hypothetical protein P0Y49_09520 [Pedobacter sp.]